MNGCTALIEVPVLWGVFPVESWGHLVNCLVFSVFCFVSGLCFPDLRRYFRAGKHNINIEINRYILRRKWESRTLQPTKCKVCQGLTDVAVKQLNKFAAVQIFLVLHVFYLW